MIRPIAAPGIAVVVLWPIRYGTRAVATTVEAPIMLLLIAGGPTWELCTASLTGADNDARWCDPGDVHGESWQQ